MVQHNAALLFSSTRKDPVSSSLKKKTTLKNTPKKKKTYAQKVLAGSAEYSNSCSRCYPNGRDRVGPSHPNACIHSNLQLRHDKLASHLEKYLKSGGIAYKREKKIVEET